MPVTVITVLLFTIFSATTVDAQNELLWNIAYGRGIAALESNDFAVAEQEFSNALLEAQRFSGENFRLGYTLAGLGKTYYYRGKYADAASTYRMALRSFEPWENKRPQDAVDILTGLTAVHLVLDERDRAEWAGREALDLLEVMSPDDPRYRKIQFTAYINLGYVNLARHNVNVAMDFYERASLIANGEKMLTQLDKACLAGYTGALYVEMGRISVATSYLREAYKLSKSAKGEQYPDSVALAFSLATLLVTQIRFDEAESILGRLIEHVPEWLGTSHPTYGFVLGSMGHLRQKQGRLEEAKKFYSQALEILQPVFDDGHQSLTYLSLRLGQIALEEKNYSEARRLLERAIAGKERRDGPDSFDLVEDGFLESHAALLRQTGEEGRARELEKRIEKIRLMHGDEAATSPLPEVLDGPRPE